MINFIPLKLIPDNTQIKFMQRRKVNFSISAIAILISLISVMFFGINFGIDFTGGTIIEAKLAKEPKIIELYSELSKEGFDEVQIQDFDINNIMVKFPSKSASNQDDINKIKLTLNKFFNNNIEYRKIDFVGPQVGSKLINKGILAVIIAAFSILAYIAFRFEWQYGVGIILALIHDIIVTLGFISFTQIEFDLSSIAAILTIIGYSVNDSVVIYDRIRENFKKYKKPDIKNIIDRSINETLSRTTLTIVTTLIAVLALIIYGGPAISGFSKVVFFGILVGTYSSIYTSAPILIHLGIQKYSRD